MIPYDDLVIALTTWRARQGLPVGQLSGALTPPPAAVAAPIASYGSAGAGAGAGSGSGRMGAPPPRPTSARPAMPLASPDTHEDSLDVDDAALIEEHADPGLDDDYPLNASATNASARNAPGMNASAMNASGETLLDGDVPDDETVNGDLETAMRGKPPAW